MKVNVLGTTYTIERKTYEEFDDFKKYGWVACCDEVLKLITIGRMDTFPNIENEPKEFIDKLEKQNLRHELIHAFLNESGLSSNASQSESWAKNEEMVDWFAIQSPKIFNLFKELKLL